MIACYRLLFIWALSLPSVARGFAPIPLSCLQQQHPNFRMTATGNNEQDIFIENVLIVQCGFGNDSHGQNATKAAIRACRNAIELNSVRVTKIIPGGYDAMKLDVILGVPKKYQDTLELELVAQAFPFGETRFQVKDGGLIAPSGRAIAVLGDKNDDMVLVAVAVQLGY